MVHSADELSEILTKIAGREITVADDRTKDVCFDGTHASFNKALCGVKFSQLVATEIVSFSQVSMDGFMQSASETFCCDARSHTLLYQYAVGQQGR